MLGTDTYFSGIISEKKYWALYQYYKETANKFSNNKYHLSTQIRVKKSFRSKTKKPIISSNI